MISSLSAPRLTRPSTFGASAALLALLFVLIGSPGDARAATVKIVKPATLVFVHGARADAPGNCGAVIFAQWAHVPGVTSARAVYHRPDGTQLSEGASGPDFHNTTDHVITFKVTPGFDWISVGYGSIAGATPDDCSDMSERQKAAVDLSPAKTSVELSVEAKPPVIKSIRGQVKLGATRLAAIATVACPAGGACTITAPTTTAVRIAGTKYTLTVVSPKRVAGGKSATVSVRFTRAAAAALGGRNVSPAVRVAAANHVEAKASAVVSRMVKG